MPILNYLLDKYSSKEGFWGANGTHPYTFQPIIKDIYERHDIKSILEIGFNIGCSATMWLEWDESEQVYIQSVDICNHKDTINAASDVKKKYGNRFSFLACDSLNAWDKIDRQFDMGFIDGNHDLNYVENDINLCINKGAKILVFDDYHKRKDTTINGVRTKIEEFVDSKILTEDKIYDIPDPHIKSQIAVFKVI